MATIVKNSILKDWTDAHTAKFQKDILTAKHRLSETGLFTDEALIALLDKHPSESLDVCTMSQDHPLYPNKFRTGDFRECDGKTLLAAAKAGKIWINVRRAMNLHAEYKEVLDDMYGSLARASGKPVYNARGGILISSPAARVPYHCDQTETILWHVRGKKRIYIYPLTQEFLPDEAYHNIITHALEDDVPYTPDMDESARYFDLEPDQMICWKLNAPHRVDNQSFCVSVTTEYSTRESALKNSVMYTNAVLSSKFGMKTNFEKSGQAERLFKYAAGRLLRKAGLGSPDGENKDLVTFKIDSSHKDFVVDCEPYERNF